MRTIHDNKTTLLPALGASSTEAGQNPKTTKPEKRLLIAAALSAVLLATAAYFSQQVLRGQASGARSPGAHELGEQVTLTPLAGSGQGFGPLVEATLPAPRTDGETRILDLESGRCMTQPGLAHFHDDAGALMAWIRANRLNISSRVWPDGSAACLTYNLTVVPVETKCWEQAAAEDMPDIPVLSPGQHSPRRLLVLGPGRPATYAFRTDAGRLGMLRLVGLSDDEQGVRIRYKLVQTRGETHGEALTLQ